MQDLWKKLNYKGQNPVLIVDAPESLTEALESLALADGLHRKAAPGVRYGFVLVFAAMVRDLSFAAPAALAASGDDCVLWFAFPKQASKKFSSDLNRDVVWRQLEPLGIQPNRNVAVDDDWSALRFKRV